MVVGKLLPHGVLDICNCAKAFGRELQGRNKGGNGRNTEGVNTELSSWIVRGLECYLSRVRVAAVEEIRVAVPEEETEENEIEMENEGDTVMCSASPRPSSAATPVASNSTGAAASVAVGAAPSSATSATTKTDSADRFRSYMGKARKKSTAAEKAAQGADFGLAINSMDWHCTLSRCKNKYLAGIPATARGP